MSKRSRPYGRRWSRFGGVGIALSVLVVLLAPYAPSRADMLPSPTGPVLLTVSGAVQNTNAPGEARFDRAMLDALGLRELVSSTPHTQGRPVWRGVGLGALLHRVGARGERAVGFALDGYSVGIPMDVVERYDPIIALEREGKRLRVRDGGPGWVIFPWDEHPEITDQAFSGMSIWQLERLRIE
ncbi:MAG: molybdopterin-dependent oxidoreductase [Geminicoccaceae bacterium]|nr:molybdopterin-dependent oxidoreductase [Geminicoccaceae bacterium]